MLFKLVICLGLIGTLLAGSDGFYIDSDAKLKLVEMQCLRHQGHMLVLDCWEDGSWNSECNEQYQVAVNASFPEISIIARTCPNCDVPPSPEKFIEYLTQHLTRYAIKPAKLYFFIAKPEKWYSDPQQNIDYLLHAMDAARAAGLSVAVWSDQATWGQIFQDKWDETLLLMDVVYMHYPSSKDYNDWPQQRFGEWSQPSLKMYGMVSICTYIVGQIWHP